MEDFAIYLCDHEFCSTYDLAGDQKNFVFQKQSVSIYNRISRSIINFFNFKNHVQKYSIVFIRYIWATYVEKWWKLLADIYLKYLSSSVDS